MVSVVACVFCVDLCRLQATQVLPGEQQEKKKGGKGKGRAASSGKVSNMVEKRGSSCKILTAAILRDSQPSSSLSIFYLALLFVLTPHRVQSEGKSS